MPRTCRRTAHAAEAWAQHPGRLNAVLLFASMPEQKDMDATPELAHDCIAATYGGAVSILQHLAPHIEARKGGTIIGIGSVAGDRGRLKNYIYGSAKAGLHTYLAGLRNRLGRSGAHVLTAKLGFVDTALTWGAPGIFLAASPEMVAQQVPLGRAAQAQCLLRAVVLVADHADHPLGAGNDLQETFDLMSLSTQESRSRRKAAGSSRLAAAIALMRPKQWVKNGFILVPMFFSGHVDL